MFIGWERKRGRWLIVLTVLAGLCMLVEALADQQLVRGAAHGRLSISVILLVLGAYAVSYFIALQKMVQRVKLQADTRRVLNTRHFSWFESRPRANGEVSEEASAAIPLKRTPYYLSYYLDEVFDFIYESVFLVACTTALFLIDWRVGLTIVVFYPAAWGIGRVLGPRVSTVTERADQALSQYMADFVDLLRSRRQILSFNLPQIAFDRVAGSRQTYLRDQRRAKELTAAGQSFQEAIGQIREIGLLAVVSMTGRSELSALFLALYLAGMSAEPVKRWAAHHQSISSVRGLRETIHKEVAEASKPIPITRMENASSYSCASLSVGDQLLGHDFFLPITPGLIRIVGANGAGKSILLADLAGERAEVQGKIFGSDSQPLAGLPECIRLEAGTPLLAGTVRDNVTLFESDEDSERWAMVVRYLGDLAARDEVSTLSGGERQRVLAARVLYQNPSLCLLDEALCSMDPKQKLRTLRFLREECSGTVFVVEHHLSREEERVFTKVLTPF